MGHQNYDFTERVYIDTSKDIYGLEEATYMNEYIQQLLENSEGQECYDLASLQNIIDVLLQISICPAKDVDFFISNCIIMTT